MSRIRFFVGQTSAIASKGLSSRTNEDQSRCIESSAQFTLRKTMSNVDRQIGNNDDGRLKYSQVESRCQAPSSVKSGCRRLASLGIQMSAKLTADMKRVVVDQRLAFVATVCPDGTPNLSPKGTISVWDDDHLVFADLRSPGTIANLQKNPAVEINVVDPFTRKGYRFKGTGEVIVDGELFQQIMNFYRGRWVDAARSESEARIRGFVLVKVERALPLTSPAYDDTSVDEQSIRKHWISYFAALNEG